MFVSAFVIEVLRLLHCCLFISCGFWILPAWIYPFALSPGFIFVFGFDPCLFLTMILEFEIKLLHLDLNLVSEQYVTITNVRRFKLGGMIDNLPPLYMN